MAGSSGALGPALLGAEAPAAALASLLSRAAEWASALSAVQAGLLLASAAAAVGGLLLQYEGQRYVPAASAQPIYAASPFLSALWAWLVLSEPVTASECVGGLGIGGAAWLARSGGNANGNGAGSGGAGGNDDGDGVRRSGV